MKVFSIDGYFTDDKDDEFQGYPVAELHGTPDGWDDSNIFYYGLSESGIQAAISSGEPVDDFVITSYSVIDE